MHVLDLCSASSWLFIFPEVQCSGVSGHAGAGEESCFTGAASAQEAVETEQMHAADATKEDAIKENAVNEDSTKEDVIKEDPIKEDAIQEGAIKEDGRPCVPGSQQSSLQMVPEGPLSAASMDGMTLGGDLVTLLTSVYSPSFARDVMLSCSTPCICCTSMTRYVMTLCTDRVAL